MFTLRDYQKKMVHKIIETPNLLLVAPMGSGKTLSTLCAVTSLIVHRNVKNVLIVAPKRVAMSVWEQEAKQNDMGLHISFCKTSGDIKSHIMESADHAICVCSVTRITDIPDGLWDMVIADESTLFGNVSSQRSKEMRRICKGVKRRLLLTGTPIHGGYEKLWHQIALLGGGSVIGKSLTKFKEMFMVVKYHISGVVTKWDINPNMIKPLRDAIDPYLYVVTESAKLPPALYKNVYITLPEKRMKEYVTFEQESIVGFKEETTLNAYSDSKTLVAFAASSRGAKLRQLASGCVYADETNSTYSVTHRLKIEALKELRESNERGLLVAYAFRSELQELKKAFPEARQLDTAQDIDDWNKGDIPIALVHPASVGHGLNLQFGGHIIVWYSLTYDAELYAQANKRLHRSGQSETVSVVHLIAAATIDEKVLRVVEKKERYAHEFTGIN